ncbi:uncharacterized protein LOC130693868 [Daphnia carinata]|uniref:uncharacterized protein LOC130693868 n=1 Tax=Daphnia carinata TaxID=120202 RepID=UPI00257984DB|nr:uncharacterized protein LOC130693868 [Daphnia carinata]XP_059350450.1 uncharacterized protein LOC130693868 [Daphnia carinata]
MASKSNASTNITYNRRDVLGKGHYSVVFRGSFESREVAVKRVLKEYAPIISDENEFLQLKHPNIEKLLAIDNMEEFRLYAFDLAVGNLDDFCCGKYSGPMPEDREAMLQMAKGLEYIHSKQMVHCNLNPQNIRISGKVPTRLMIAVFGCCNKTNEGEYVSLSRKKETDVWIAPEIVARHHAIADEDVSDEDNSGEERHTVSSDIWTLGCVFFYFLTRGKHPFGSNSSDINWNISVTRKPVELEKLDLYNSVEDYAKIKSMITMMPAERERLNQVIYNLENDWSCVDELAHSDYQSAAHLPEVSAPRTRIIQSPPRLHFQMRQDSSDHQIIGVAQMGDEFDSPVRGRIVSDGMGELFQSARGNSPDYRHRRPGGQRSGHHPMGEYLTDRTSNQLDAQLQLSVKRLSDQVEELQDELKRTAYMLEEKVKLSHEKIGHLNETAIRKKVTTDAAKRSLENREIKSLTQLVKCYCEAKGTRSSEEDIDKVCRHVVSYLKKNNSEKHFCRWYHEEAIKYVQQKAIKDVISEHQICNKKGNINYEVTDSYKTSRLRNYINGPMTSDHWNNFSGTRSSIFLLALFESLKDKKDLMSFPPPGILTMDIPVKISSAKKSVHIEIGEIKSSGCDAVIRKARTQLKRSLLCFQWLDKIIETQVDYYGLIGIIYIDGNRHSHKENSEDYEDEFTFKVKYETYT